MSIHDFSTSYSSDQVEAAQFLLDAGASANSKNGAGETAVMVAAAKGGLNVLKVLVSHPTADLAAQVCNALILLARNKHESKNYLSRTPVTPEKKKEM